MVVEGEFVDLLCIWPCVELLLQINLIRIFGYIYSDGNGGGGDGGGRIMLNVDIALVRDFSGSLDSNTGEVSCLFGCPDCQVDTPPMCPFSRETFSFMQDYRNDNSLFLSDFEDVFSRTLVNGYDTSSGCSEGGDPCRLPGATSRSGTDGAGEGEDRADGFFL